MNIKTTNDQTKTFPWKPFLLSIALVLMVWFVFGQTLTFDFVNYDDPQYVTDNPLVLSGITWKGVLRALTHNDYSFYHPFTTISHMLDFEIYGLNPAGFHFTNVVFHTMSAVILFLVLRSMTGSLWKSFMVAAVFAIHPLRAESVAWATERKDCLSGFFFMLTLAAYHGYVGKVGGRRAEVGGQRAEVGGLKREDGGQRAEVGGRRTEDGGQRAEDGGLKREDGGQRREDGGRRAEVGGLKRENRGQTSEVRERKSSIFNRQSAMLFPPQNTQKIQNENGALSPKHTEKFQALENPLHGRGAHRAGWVLPRFGKLFRRRSALLNYGLVFLLMAACMLSKATVVTLPFVLLLLDYWPLGRMQSIRRTENGGEKIDERNERRNLATKERREDKEKRDTAAKNRKSRKKVSLISRIPIYLQFPLKPKASNLKPFLLLVLEKLPFFLLSAVMAAVMVISSKESIISVESVPFHWRLSNAVVSYVTYIGQLFVPINLAVLYPFPTDPIPFWKSGGSILILGGITLWAWRSASSSYKTSPLPQSEIGNQKSAMLTGWLWFLGMLVPMIGIMQTGVQAHADRYTYLSHIGLLILVIWGVSAISSKRKIKKTLLTCLFLTVLFSTILQARSQIKVWRSSFPLFTSALESTRKNFAILGAMGVVFMKHGEIVAATHCYKQALSFNSQFTQARYNLGNAYVAVGRFEDAIKQYQIALELRPSLVQAHYNLGICYLKTGRDKEAIFEYELLIKKDPLHQIALHKLAWILATSPDETIRNGDRAVRLALRAMKLSEKQDQGGLESMAAAHAEVGDFAQAIEFQEEAVFLVEDSESTNSRARLRLYKKRKPFRR